ncbi:probable tubulin polyglutamylase TTLL2 [Pygocentrus nattereri]|uniref:probable tubulin polyglutamylase TTLL2 n=1 Tax=Pygocentrus nattereri TaxID=42514 RepID=UPI000814B332|nr:probable tubulin polyglutamylase TTLL2 [Pygocentrus nattereri]
MATNGSAPLVFRLHENTPEVVREVLLERGWEEYDPHEQVEGDWNLYWRTSAFRNFEYENILPWQRLNHHPKMTRIARKDYLARNLRRMRGTYGAALYGFSPTAFILPNDYIKFLEVYTKTRVENAGKPGYWICKPVDLSRGRGIFIFDDIKHLAYNSHVIVQKYISNPLLISGYKFDLRIYVCVKSFCPLTIYMHQEGLVRFATEKYNLASLDNLFSHLTNTSINKFGPFYTTDKERVGQGCKWTLSKFRSFLHSQGINELLLWQKINNIVTLTLLTMASSIPSSPNCLELFGFDILIDSNLKPWLLEVNYSPALSLDCPADIVVKKGVINDLIDLMNYRKVDGLRQRGCLRRRHKRTCCLGSPSSQRKSLAAFLIPKSVSGKKRQRQSSLNSLHAENLVCPSVERSVNSLGSTLHPACQNSKTIIVSGNKKKSPLQVEGPTCWSELEESFEDHRDIIRRCSSHACRLPAIHAPKYKPPRFSWDQGTHEMTTPSLRVGDFILTFPFNEATWKASQDTLDVKTVLHEVHQLMSQLTFSCVHKEKRRKENNDSSAAIKNKFASLLWGPRNPPLLSEYCSSS